MLKYKRYIYKTMYINIKSKNIWMWWMLRDVRDMLKMLI